MKRLLTLVALLSAALLSPTVASAQAYISRSPSTAPVLGQTIRGMSTTTYSISTSGGVTRVSGDAIRLTNASVTTPTITITCGFLNLSFCSVRNLRVTITPVVDDGPYITRLRVGSLSGTTYRTGSAPSDAASLTFDLNPIGIFGSASFRLGMDVVLPANSPSGVQTFDYVVTVTLL